MDRDNYIGPMAEFDIRFFNQKTRQIEVVPFSRDAIGDVPNKVSSSQLALRRYIRNRVKNIINAALIGEVLDNIAEYFELVYSFIDMSVTNAPFPNFVQNTTSFDFGDFCEIRRMMYDLSEKTDLFRNERILIDMVTYVNQYMKNQDQDNNNDLAQTLDDIFVELFEKYNAKIREVDRTCVLVAPDTPKYIESPYALPTAAQKDTRVILPPDGYSPGIVSMPDIPLPQPEQPEEEPKEDLPPVISEFPLIDAPDPKNNNPVGNIFTLPNKELMVPIVLKDGKHYLVLPKDYPTDGLFTLKESIESSFTSKGKILTVFKLLPILYINYFKKVKGWSRTEIADYMYRTKQMTTEDIKEYT